MLRKRQLPFENPALQRAKSRCGRGFVDLVLQPILVHHNERHCSKLPRCTSSSRVVNYGLVASEPRRLPGQKFKEKDDNVWHFIV